MSRIIERALSIINDNLKDQTTSFADPISIKPMARGGEVDNSKTVRLYHGTNEKNYADIMRSRKLEGPAYFLADKSTAKNYGDGEHVVTADIPVHKLKVDFDLPGGRLLDVDEANEYSNNHDWDLHDYLDHGYAVGIEGVLVWEEKTSTGFDKKRFAQEHPDLYAKYESEVPAKVTQSPAEWASYDF